MPRLCVINGREAKLKAGSLSIQQSANDRAKMSGTIIVEDAVPALGQRIGVVKDIAPGARAFNGLASLLSRAFSSGTTNNWTIGVWARPTAVGAQRFALCVGSAVNGYGLFQTSDGYWRGVISGAAAFGGTSAPVTVDGWVLLVARRSGGNAQLFVNGQPLGSTISNAPTAPNGYITVGGRRNAGDTAFEQFFVGELSHAFVAHSALTDAQILALAQGGPGGMGLAPDRILTGTYWYYPVLGLASPEPDSAASTSLTVTSAPAITEGPVVASVDADMLFAGEIDQSPQGVIGGHVSIGTEVRVGASDHQGLIARVLVSMDRPAETLKARLTALLTPLAPYGVTVDGSHDNGPTVSARSYDDVPLASAIESLSKECVELGDPRLLWIDEVLVARMAAPSGRVAPFDVTPTIGNVVGTITVKPSLATGYANRVVLIAGKPGAQVQRQDTFTGDGTTDEFPLTYVPVGFRGLVTRDGNEEPLHSPAWWTYDPVANSITRHAGAPANGNSISIIYTSVLPLRVEAKDASWDDTPFDVKIEDQAIQDLAPAQAAADAELATRLALATQQTVTYATLRDGLRVGMTQHVEEPELSGLDADVVITELSISDVAEHDEYLRYQVTAVDGVNFQTWRQKERSGTGVSTSLAGTGQFIVPVGGQSSDGNVVAQLDTDHETEIGRVGPFGVGISGLAGLRLGPRDGEEWYLFTRENALNRREVALFHAEDPSDLTALSVYYSPTESAYILGPTTLSGAALKLGSDTLSRRITEVNANIVYASTGLRERGRSVYAGEWQSFTPTWGVTSGTAPAIGDGSIVGSYAVIGKTVHFRITLTAGASTTFGSGGAWTFTLPLACPTLSASTQMASVVGFDTSTPTFAHGHAMFSSTTVMLPRLGAALSVITNASPWAWATGDTLVIRGTYEAA